MNWNRLDLLGFNWSQWIPLESPIQVYHNHITKNPGLYRVRITHNRKLAYIGQTGRDLRERTRQLSSKVNNNQDNPPWNDPHTAAPALWAWKIENNYRYEVSVFAIDLETTSLSAVDAQIVGIALSFDACSGFYVACNEYLDPSKEESTGQLFSFEPDSAQPAFNMNPLLKLLKPLLF